MRENECHKIIAVNPGWRYLSIAVFEESALKEWRLKSLHGLGVDERQEKAINLINSFIAQYQPNILAVKALHRSRSSENLDKMASNIRACGRRKKLIIVSLTIQEIKKALVSRARFNKKEIIQLMAQEYPELAHEQRRESRNRNPYFVRLFEAVALGHACLSQINKKQ